MSGLPSGYTQLEYIRSSGTQYVDTGIKPNQNTRVLMDARLDQGSACYLYGCRGDNAAGYNNRFGIMYTGTFFRSDFGVGNGLTFPSTIRTSVRYQMDKNKQTCTIGDASVVNTNASFQSDLPMYFFCVREGPDAKYFASLTLYSCNIYDDGVLVRNYQPCINASGEIGLYDTVDGKFYANAGTGTFTAGPEIIPDPPAAPTGLQTVLAVVLQWAASANADRYDVYRDGAKLGSTETTQYIDATPEANQTYVYTVKAVNGGGESVGVSVTVYTKSGYFQYKPLIESANFP